MTLPTGLVPALAFVLTVGTAVPVALGAHLFHRTGNAPFGSGLRAALAEAGGLYLVGVIVVWSIAGGIGLWEVAVTLLVAGFVAAVALVALPLVVGQQLVRYASESDPETALRFATYGWPVAMLVVFAIFLAPGGLVGGDLFALTGKRVCLAGHCGIAAPFVLAAAVELAVAVLGPGVVGLVLRSRTTAGRA